MKLVFLCFFRHSSSDFLYIELVGKIHLNHILVLLIMNLLDFSTDVSDKNDCLIFYPSLLCILHMAEMLNWEIIIGNFFQFPRNDKLTSGWKVLKSMRIKISSPIIKRNHHQAYSADNNVRRTPNNKYLEFDFWNVSKILNRKNDIIWADIAPPR